MTNKDIAVVENVLGYEFNNKSLLVQAFKRKSYCDKKGGESQDILSWLGRGFLEQFTIRMITQKWGVLKEDVLVEYGTEVPVSDMMYAKNRILSSEILSNKIRLMGFDQYLYMGANESKVKKEEDMRNAELFSAIIGAVVIDTEWDFKEINRVIKIFLQPSYYLDSQFSEKGKNYIELVQAWSMREYQELPNYIFSDFEGAIFCNLYLKNIKQPFRGYGHSGGEAKMFASREAYRYLGKEQILKNIRQEVEVPTKENAINQMQILWFKKMITEPHYEFSSRKGEDGKFVWKCDCYVEEYEDYFYAESSSKMDAKKTAALAMLRFLLGYDE